MNKIDTPFNIDLLIIPPEIKNTVRQVTALDVYNGLTKNFHPNGLYSVETFGVVGTDARYEKYSWIDIKISIFHPTIYLALVQLKSFYAEILSGKGFAVFDEKMGDFVKSNALEGKTGFQFFVENWKKIRFQSTNSSSREQAIRLVEKYKEKCMLDKIYVLPAGYRDLEIDDSGRESSDEINSSYYMLMAVSNTINEATLKLSPQAYNSQRMSLQNKFNEIYKAMLTIIEGKKNLFMGKWASRKVFNSTRNVITAMDTTTSELGGKGSVGINDSLIGIFQYMKTNLQVVMYQIKTGFLSEVFASPSAPVLLTNRKTMESERVYLSHEVFDRWMTDEGVQKLINIYREPSLRDEPILIEGYYLGLMYRGPDDTFKMIHGISELPEGRDPKHCTPLTFTEFFYACIYAEAHRYPMFVTRYPIASDRSTYPSMVYLKSTIKFETRQELSRDWRSLGPERIAYQFPVRGSDTFNSLSPHSARLAKLNGDFDGDTSSGTVVYSEESIAEVKKVMGQKSFYVGPDGRFSLNLETDTVGYVLQNLTGD